MLATIKTRTVWSSCFLLMLVSFFAVVGCRKDTGGDPLSPVDCAISDLGTSLFESGFTGDPVNLRWTQNGVPATVLIELLKGTAVVDTIALAAANSGFFPWVASTGGQANGSDFGIRVSGTGLSGCAAEVGGLNIVDMSGCGVTITAPRDTVLAGQSFAVTWDGFHTSGLVDIELWTTAFGSVLGDIAGTIVTGAPDTGSYTWIVDSFNRGTYGFFRYVVRDATVSTCSDTSLTFAMVDPDICSVTINGIGQSVPVTVNDVVQIMIDQLNGSGAVNLRLYAGNVFVPGGFLGDNVLVLNPFNWTVNDFGFQMGNSNFRIRAIDVTDGYCVGTSDRFTIIRP